MGVGRSREVKATAVPLFFIPEVLIQQVSVVSDHTSVMVTRACGRQHQIGYPFIGAMPDHSHLPLTLALGSLLPHHYIYHCTSRLSSLRTGIPVNTSLWLYKETFEVSLKGQCIALMNIGYYLLLMCLLMISV